MTATHNVLFETADVEVSAHDHVLAAASPVLQAMLDSTMLEGSRKRIPVRDSSNYSVRFVLDMLYTSSTRDDPDYTTMLGALDLAHRWQVHSMVPILASMLKEMITTESFVAIAESAVLKELQPLQRACVAFGSNDAKVQNMLEKGELPASVCRLLGKPAAEVPQGKQKRRRMFTAP